MSAVWLVCVLSQHFVAAHSDHTITVVVITPLWCAVQVPVITHIVLYCIHIVLSCPTVSRNCGFNASYAN